jgi:hypothetical protein
MKNLRDNEWLTIILGGGRSLHIFHRVLDEEYHGVPGVLDHTVFVDFFVDDGDPIDSAQFDWSEEREGEEEAGQ